MTNLLVRLFIKNSEDVNNTEVRTRYGILGGIVGIILNIILFAGKIFAGIITSSIAITADAFNNLSDAGSSIIAFVGFKIANKPADNEHPFGHGRVEYISGFTISMIIILMAFELGKTSISKIINPVDVTFKALPFIILIIAILLKLWMCLFNKKLSKIINSSALKATAMDSLSDAIATSTVIVGFVLSYALGVNIDGYLGVLVALFILYTGISSAKELLDCLLGEAPDKEYVEKLKRTVLAHEVVSGVHDVVVHNYGVGKCVVSLHAEVPCEMDILVLHEIIDSIEMELKEKHHCSAVIHMDPIAINDEETLKIAQDIMGIIKSIDELISMHDFRMVHGENQSNLIFDIVIPFKYKIKDNDLIKLICDKIKEYNPAFNPVINIDKEPM